MTAEGILSIARQELGTKESPAGSNRVKYAQWFGLNGQPWCVMFVDWVFNTAGARELLPVVTASCTVLMNAAKQKGLWVTRDYRPGDVPVFNFSGSYHTGIIESVEGDLITTIEGNTAVGNDSNGGQVMRRSRNKRQIMGAVRPHYEKEAAVAGNEVEQAMKWASDTKIIQDGNWSATPTRRQIAIMLYRFAKWLGKI